MRQRFRGIIFDMDGVLVDSERFYYQRRKKFLEKYNLSIASIPITKFIGADMRSLWPMILSNNVTDYQETYLNEKYLDYKKKHTIDYSQCINPDAQSILRDLKKEHYKIGLASSSKMEVIEEVLRIADIHHYFDMTVSGTQFKKSKPAPEIYEYTVEQLQLEPKDCLAIEDSEKGIQSAHDAGLAVWALKDQEFGMNQKLADKQLNTLAELREKLI